MVNITPAPTATKKNHAKKSTGGKAPKKTHNTNPMKQTAQKSTGGPAPRLRIGAPAPAADSSVPEKAPSLSGTSSLPEHTPRAATSESLRRSERVAVAKLARSPSPRAEVVVPSNEDKHCSNMELDTDGDNVELSKDEHLCAGCQDGGTLLHCEGYRLIKDDSRYRCGRLVCYGPPDSRKCIEIYDEALKHLVQDKNIGFVCPPCWQYIHKSQGLKYDVPYEGFFKRDDGSVVTSVVKTVHSVRATFFSRLELVPMAIVSIALEGMATEPFSMTLIEVEGYYLTTPIPCVHASLTFNLSDGKRQQYDTDFMKMFALLKQHNVKRVVIFLTTHSTPEGDLHFIPNMGGSAPVPEILDAIFPAEFRTFLQPISVDSTLFMLSCGGVYMQKESFDYFTDLARGHIFDRIVAFPARDLQPLQTARWCQDFVRRILLQHESIKYSMKSICDANPTVGPHTSILIWHHSPTHPISIDETQTLLTQKMIWCSLSLAPHVNGSGQKFLVVKCTAKLRSPSSGLPNDIVSGIVPPPCNPVLIPLIGSYTHTPLGTKNGNWEVVDYRWVKDEGKYSFSSIA
ncbi:hypothetical protein F5878DRAFT_663607 [Lentinula raphanica]|uniref:Uncharacterized protein n=1 Tax=Lentinula raphanica TaxID=153919 RepID=A0AA38P3Q9_9AGAR|nr:hypothetical protein F5878DRAFT_663607 [Lentinula raphanica]